MPASVIDSLILELSLDSSKMSATQRLALDQLRTFEHAATRSGTAAEVQQKKLLDFFGTLKRQAVELVGLFFGGKGVVDIFQHITNLDAATSRFAKTMAMSTAETSAWQGAIQQAGGTSEGATAALAGLSGEMSRFQITGQSAMLPVLSRLGIGLYDQNRQLKTAGQLWLEIAQAVQGWDPREATAFLQMIPGANQDMINFALLGRDAMEKYIAAARAAGTTTEESARTAREYQKAAAELEQSATSLARTFVVAVTPAVVGAMDALRNLVGLTKKENFDQFVDKAAQRPQSGLERATQWWLNAISFNKLFPVGPNAGFFDIAHPPPPARAPAGAPSTATPGLPSNWSNFLSGLSYLETSQTGAPSGSSTARGYFQFLEGTAARARGAGINDPRFGSYENQAAATQQYIKQFYPQAAAAIDRGDFAAAAAMLKGEWPSLPGGSQPQSASRYRTFAEELSGGGPRPPAAAGGPGGSTTTLNVGTINVNAPHATDAQGVAGEIEPALRRSLTAGAANTGAQ